MFKKLFPESEMICNCEGLYCKSNPEQILVQGHIRINNSENLKRTVVGKPGNNWWWFTLTHKYLDYYKEDGDIGFDDKIQDRFELKFLTLEKIDKTNEIIYFEEQNGFAKYKDSDPIVLRAIVKKP